LKFAIVNNSNNPDMVEYFRGKYSLGFKELIFCSNTNSKQKEDSFTSSYSRKNCISIWILLDAFVGLFLGLRLRLNRTRWILFDTAHISNIPLALVSKVLGIRLAFTIHDWNPHEGSMNFATRFYNKLVTSLLADHLVCFSSIDTPLPHSVLRLSGFRANQLSTQVDENQFLFFGRIEPYKGIRHLPEIAFLLKSKLPEARIAILGAGADPFLDKLEGLANVDLNNRFVPEADLNKAILVSVAVIMPYDSATQSGVLCKSFSCGTPVIAFSVGAIGSYLEDMVSGYLIPHGDLNIFTDAMVNITVTHKELRGFIQDNFEKEYGHEALVSQYKGLIKELLWKTGYTGTLL